MATRIGINGFGRMGRLALRAGFGRPDLEFAHINEVAGGPVAAAHLLTFDSVHGRWAERVEAADTGIAVNGRTIPLSAAPQPVIDGPSTMVVDGTCVKVLAWYDNEIGYVHRMVELAQRAAAALRAPA